MSNFSNQVHPAGRQDAKKGPKIGKGCDFRRLAPLGTMAAAFSAATLIALGADSIYIPAFGNLGPVDPQINVSRVKDGKTENLRFGSEDLSSFLSFAKRNVGLTDQSHLAGVFKMFCDEVGPVPVGIAARGSQLALKLGEQLLRMHMSAAKDQQRAKIIAEKLNKDYFHHGYALGRREARGIGLKVESTSQETENLLWDAWTDISDDLKLKQPFVPASLFPADSNLFSPATLAQIPHNAPPNVQQQAYQAIIQNAVIRVDPVDYDLTHALVESPRLASRFFVNGKALATRTPDLELKINMVPIKTGWEAVSIK